MSRLIDFHVHILGNGSGGSGCWLKLRGHFSWLGSYIVRHVGLPGSALTGELEKLYVGRLLEFIRDSPLDAAVILAHENVYDDRGCIMDGVGCFYVPNDFVLDLAAAHKEFIPAVSIHPAREDALDELERCLERGARVMKCLPNCQNINCADPRFRPFWERMARGKMVLLAHTGGELSVPVVNAAYADPEVLRLPLQCGVTVVAAHCGTSSGWFDRNYFPAFTRMLNEFPNLYGDNSALNSPFRSAHLRSCLKPEVAARVVHGSDLPIPVSGLWAALRRLVSWSDFRRIEKSKNLMARDYELKRAMGFPERTFTQGWELVS